MVQTLTPPSAPPAEPNPPAGARAPRAQGSWWSRCWSLGTVIGTAAALTPTLLAGRAVGDARGRVGGRPGARGHLRDRRGLPAKYLVPGTMFLVLFVVYPILATAQLSTTNFGDGTRTTKEETVARIIGSRWCRRRSPRATTSRSAPRARRPTGPFTFFLVDQDDGDGLRRHRGRAAGARPGRRHRRRTASSPRRTGYELLTPQPGQRRRRATLGGVQRSRPTTARSASWASARPSRAARPCEYDEAADTITDTQTDISTRVQTGATASYSSTPTATGCPTSPGGPTSGSTTSCGSSPTAAISGDFLRIFVWTLVFATLSVVTSLRARAAPRRDPQRPAGAGAEALPLAAAAALRHPGLHLAAASGPASTTATSA